MHGPFGQQGQDRGAHVATLAAATTARATSATAAAEGAGASESGTEAREIASAEAREAGTEAGTAVLTDVVAESATGLTSVFVQGAPIGGREAEPETGTGLARERIV